VYFAGSPGPGPAVTKPYRGGRFNDLYRSLQLAHYIAAEQAVLDGGAFTETLPCVPEEPCGPDGSNVVRAPDGVHFCPGSPEAVQGVTEGCAVWSSGAYRYGRAMAGPVIADFGL
jgi:hypothetical protein